MSGSYDEVASRVISVDEDDETTRSQPPAITATRGDDDTVRVRETGEGRLTEPTLSNSEMKDRTDDDDEEEEEEEEEIAEVEVTLTETMY